MGRRRLSPARRIELGLAAANRPIERQDQIWARFSHDKVDIADVLGRVIRTLVKELPVTVPLRGLSIGSSSEPQFRLLEAMCQGQVSLLDIDPTALQVVQDRVDRQEIPHVTLIEADMNDALGSRVAAADLRQQHLDGKRQHLILLHHALYYAPRSAWDGIFESTVRELLTGARQGRIGGALHAVLMASKTDGTMTTTALYNHWAGKFFGARNDQDLAAFGRSLEQVKWLRDAQIRQRTTEVHFDNDEFDDFMSAVWMILLHPQVHRYDEVQQAEITEAIYRDFWSQGIPLIQRQDHLVLYRGRDPRGLT